MNHQKLKKHIIALASLPEHDAPMISAYLDLQVPRSELQAELKSWADLASQSFSGQRLQDFDDALEEILEFLSEPHKAKSAAVFCRWGEYPFCLPILFGVPMETSLQVQGLPVIYPLVELKDKFDRFVLVVTTSEMAQIFEISLGEASQALLAERPELRKRLGREWTREHYHNHRKHRDQQFLKEKVSIIERLMAKRGHNSLVLAGEPRFVNRLRESLPRHLQARIAGELRNGVRTSDIPEVINQAIESFLDEESRESHNAVRRLDEAVRSGGLGLVGVNATLEALKQGQADLLVLSATLPETDREALVREAARTDTRVETVTGSQLLEKNGGAGCLLRFLNPTPFATPAS